MSDHPQQNTDAIDTVALRRMRKVNFQLYRRGGAAFHLESRLQGDIRKVTQASYKESIMTDDSISLTLVSTNRLDFRLRDYIVYDGRPYFLNMLPEAEVDNAKRYIYTMKFEGVMFEMGRIAFILRNANGYDFYGTLPEFVRLVIDNLNKANEWIEWSYEGQTYKARYVGSYEYNSTVYHRWLNRQGQVLNVNYLITADRHPSAGDHGLSPLGVTTTSTVTSYHQWTLDFPKQKATSPVYPEPSNHIPEDEYSLNWDEAKLEDMTEAIRAETREKTRQSIRENSPQGIPYEYDSYTLYPLYDLLFPPQSRLTLWQGLYPVNSDAYVWYKTLPSPSRSKPDSPTDVDVKQQEGIFAVQHQRMRCIGENDESEPVGEPDYTLKQLNRTVTYNAVLEEGNWQIDPITPSSGSSTDVDVPTESVLLSYDCHSCLAVMQDLVSQWDGWEWRIGDNVEYGYVNGEILVCGKIVMKQLKMMDEPDDFEYIHVMNWGKSGGIDDIKRKYADEGNVPSRVYFYGGTQNLPRYYRNTRLCLPTFSKEDSYIDFSEINPCPLPVALDNQTCEEIKIFDDIYPASTPFTIKSTWGISMASYTETISTEYGSTTKHFLQLTIPYNDFFVISGKWNSVVPYPFDYLEWLVLMQQPNTQDNQDRYVRYWQGKSKYLNGQDTPYIVFQTGKLAGYKLSIHDTYIEDKEPYNIILQLNVVREDNEEFHDAADTNPTTPETKYTPNADTCCTWGDKFIIEGINMPVAYTYYDDGSDGDFSAENALWQAATKYMNAKALNIAYDVDVARDYVSKHMEVFRCFDGVQFNDITTDDATVRKRVSSVELDLVDGYKYRIEVSNYKRINAASIIGKIINHNRP